ncbi:MAG: ferredoxin-type protein NapF [Arcobacteraceae bacterium]|jgi:ferredoxin-type protein NapF|nr:ferredoxin-type protein NapF [Arcobacteraceae bacterium]
MERRDIFTFLFKPKEKEKETIVRPPYFLNQFSFNKECQNCEGICANFCQEKIIVIMNDKTPKLDFNLGGCTYCDDCAIHCPTDVLNIENKQTIEVEIEINKEKCMSWHNTMCFSCKDPCLDDAIKFNGVFQPIIDIEKCTNCGFCVAVCPSSAIDFKNINDTKTK